MPQPNFVLSEHKYSLVLFVFLSKIKTPFFFLATSYNSLMLALFPLKLGQHNYYNRCYLMMYEFVV